MKKIKPKQLIIIGGGTSIKEGIKKGLWKRLRGKWTIGINYAYRYFDSTMLCFCDSKFYRKYSDTSLIFFMSSIFILFVFNPPST